MPRARSKKQADWQTAASHENGSGCLSDWVLAVRDWPPLGKALVVNEAANHVGAMSAMRLDTF